MALRNILQEGDPTLTKISREVVKFDDRLHTLLDDMRETMFDASGVGLAAPQVGILRRAVIVLDMNSEAEDLSGQVIELINPVIVESDGEQEGWEGCLSIPGVMGMVKRPLRVKVRAQDRNGDFFEVEGEGMTARAFAHEIDHLDGKLYSSLCDRLVDVNDLDSYDDLELFDETESE